ncbi:MAG: hypothetical protein AAGI50_08900 [Pseudomonadota bacterium]
MRRALSLTAAALLAAPTAFAEDYVLSLTGTAMRDYYCQIRVTLENTTDAPVTEISGFFYNYLDGAEVGRSRGAWFMNVAPGETADAVFETPNAPCEAVERYEFVVGACRFETSFVDKGVCAGRLGFTAPLALAGGE